MKSLPYIDPVRAQAIEDLLATRIGILDGAMGTMIQSHRLEEADYRGERFAHGFDALFTPHDTNHRHGPGCGCAHDQRGNNDLLNLTRPELIRSIHREYLDAGADFVETNTFNSTSLSLADYGLEHLARELNCAGARLAREACDAAQAFDGQPRYVIGVLGPTSKTASLSPDVNRPGFRATTFAELRDAYADSTRGLIEGGADIIMIETVFDTLNAKAAVFAVETAFEDQGHRLPVMISGTITDSSGRTLSGQTADAFWYSLRHAEPLTIGLNCALGAAEMRAYIDLLATVAPDTYISCHPNAGLPNAFGGYDESPEDMATVLTEFAESGLVNLVGGCCGTTPEHIRAFRDALVTIAPRQLRHRERVA